MTETATKKRKLPTYTGLTLEQNKRLMEMVVYFFGDEYQEHYDDWSIFWDPDLPDHIVLATGNDYYEAIHWYQFTMELLFPRMFRWFCANEGGDSRDVHFKKALIVFANDTLFDELHPVDNLYSAFEDLKSHLKT